jgi:hypothetical protein
MATQPPVIAVSKPCRKSRRSIVRVLLSLACLQLLGTLDIGGSHLTWRIFLQFKTSAVVLVGFLQRPDYGVPTVVHQAKPCTYSPLRIDADVLLQDASSF